MDARALHASLKKARDGPSQLDGVSLCVVKWSRSVEMNEGGVLALVWLWNSICFFSKTDCFIDVFR